MKRYNHHHLKSYRKSLRTNGTPAEAILWPHLKNRQLLGIRFRRQYSVDNYILDFYSPEIRLAIELDGHHHFTDEGIEKDKIRDDDLKSLEIRILRFENNEVTQHVEGVLEEIKDVILGLLEKG